MYACEMEPYSKYSAHLTRDHTTLGYYFRHIDLTCRLNSRKILGDERQAVMIVNLNSQ